MQFLSHVFNIGGYVLRDTVGHVFSHLVHSDPEIGMISPVTSIIFYEFSEGSVNLTAPSVNLPICQILSTLIKENVTNEEEEEEKTNQKTQYLSSLDSFFSRKKYPKQPYPYIILLALIVSMQLCVFWGL